MESQTVGEDIIPEEKYDITLQVENLEQTDPPVLYRAWCVDKRGETVVVTIFEDSRPDIDLREGHRYEFLNVEGVRWPDGKPGLEFRFGSSVRSLSDEEGTDSPTVDGVIKEGTFQDIKLRVDTIQRDTNPKVAYYAWCSDDSDRTVAVTVFEDNKPDTELEEGHRYELRNVKGERWENGTPAVTVRPRSRIKVLDTDEDTDWEDQIGPRGLMIDAISADSGERNENTVTIPPWSGVLASGLVTGIAIVASLFARQLTVWMMTVLLLFGIALAMASAYFLQYAPFSDLQRKQKRRHVRAFLEMLRKDYFELAESGGSVRANVMTNDREGLFSNSQTLGVYSASGDYKQSELNLEYDLAEKQGPWARAFANETVEIYGTNRRPEAIIDLAPEQRELVSCQSSLSHPIVVGTGRNRRTIGVLNIDSTEPLEVSDFDDEEIQRLAQRYTELIGDVIR